LCDIGATGRGACIEPVDCRTRSASMHPKRVGPFSKGSSSLRRWLLCLRPSSPLPACKPGQSDGRVHALAARAEPRPDHRARGDRHPRVPGHPQPIARGRGEGRLAQRFVMLFGFSALVPSMVVAIFPWRGRLPAASTTGSATLPKPSWKRTSRSSRTMSTISKPPSMWTCGWRPSTWKPSRATSKTLHGGRERRAGDVEGHASSRRVRQQRCRKGFSQTLAYREFVTISIVSADGQEIIAEENAGTPVRLRPPPDAFRGS
jgi:hypothetical protein